jgi:hypothetical protein
MKRMITVSEQNAGLRQHLGHLTQIRIKISFLGYAFIL